MRKRILVMLGLAITVCGFWGCGKKEPSHRMATKNCLGHRRVLLGAIEMYNMDRPQPIKALDDTMYRENGVLVGTYLKTPLQLPYEKCRYRSLGDLSDSKNPGTIVCDEHADQPGGK